MRTLTIALICLTATVSACDHEAATADNTATVTLGLTEGTPTAVGLLAFINDSSTTLEVLDHEVPLNKRAAQNIIHRRDGWDQTAGTWDDNLFDTVEDLDLVPWVGPASMDRIIDYAITEGWVPMGDDFLGTWDGVTFSVTEAQFTLDLVNTASHDFLDDDLALDRRAANSIVDAGEIASIAQLAGLYYVGYTALSTLKAAGLAQAENGLQAGLGVQQSSLP